MILGLGFLYACSDSGHEHINAEGMVLMLDGEEIFRYEAPNDPGTPITVEEGQTLGPLQIMFIDRDGELFITDNPEFNLQWTIQDTDVARIEQLPGDEWVINLIGVNAGETQVMFEVFHIDHSDFETLWFDLVTIAPTED